VSKRYTRSMDHLLFNQPEQKKTFFRGEEGSENRSIPSVSLRKDEVLNNQSRNLGVHGFDRTQTQASCQGKVFRLI